MTETSNLNLPYLASNQTQKHVILNESLSLLDVMVQLAVRDTVLTEPPSDLNEGDRFIVATGGQGAWAGQDGRIAAWTDGYWRFLLPQPGWLAVSTVDQVLHTFDGQTWQPFSQLGEVDRIAINASIDPSHRLSARLDSALFTHEPQSDGGTGDVRVTLNKAAPENVLSLLFQTGWSGRAEIGLAGNDALAFRVSADGQSFHDGLILEPGSGRVQLVAGADVPDVNGGPLGGMRNAVINGCFRIWSRGDDIALTSAGFGPDRFRIEPDGGVTVRRLARVSTVAPGGPEAGGLQLTDGAGAHTLETRLEPASVFSGGTATLQAWIHVPATADVTAKLRRRLAGSDVDIAPRSVLPNLQPGWTQLVSTFDVPATTASSEANDYLAIRLQGLPEDAIVAAVQLEPGPLPTPFELRPLGVEQAACARFFERFGGARPYHSFGLASSEGVSLARFVLAYQEKRVFPVIREGGSFRLRRPGGASAATIDYWFMPSLTTARAEISSSNLTPGGAHEFSAANDPDAYIEIDAEL